jgi:hypothetical protein
MWRAFCVGVLIALGACASASRIDRSAAQHEARAKQLAKDGDWQAANKEHRKAEKQAEKANSRRGFEDAMPVVFN